MAHFTKQQITEIASRLGTFGVKDSQFEPVSSTRQAMSFSILQGGKNKLLSQEQLNDRVAKDLDLSKVPINLINGVNNLKATLEKIYEEALVKGNQGNTLTVKATGVVGTYIIDGTTYSNVNDALLQVIASLAGFTIATEQQINTIFNQE